MRSIKEIFVKGIGPSSSHTMGPVKACEYILNKYNNISFIKVTLFGSLASTGKGHLTDYYINLKFKDIPHEIIFNYKKKTKHPNTMEFMIVDSKGKHHIERLVSIGGGTIIKEGEKKVEGKDIYPHNSMSEILEYCKNNDLSLAEYVKRFEESDINEYINDCINAMDKAFRRGIETEGELPGDLHLKRKAPEMYKRLLKEPQPKSKATYELIMTIASTAVSEENAAGGEIVIAPTAGSSGVIPGVLSYLYARGNTREEMIEAMLVAGLIGILCKTNASVSGAEAGCQAEIGVACAMGAAAIAYCKKMPNHKIAQSAEIALEHSLGLTCDPVHGYVQVPCIERNAIFALKAKNAVTIAKLVPSEYTIISFDDSVKTMFITGKDLRKGYRETSKKGLAALNK